MRSMNSAFTTGILSNAVRTAESICIKYASGPVRLCDYAHDLDIDGYTYTATGVMSTSGVTETDSLEISSLEITFSALVPGLVAAFLLYDHHNLELTQSRAVLDDSGNVLGTITLFDGLTIGGGINDAESGGAPSVQIKGASHFGDLDQKAGRYTNSASQTDHFPGDRGFDHVDKLADPLIWGRPDRV